MLNVPAMQAWWNFFHRYSLVFEPADLDRFDEIVLSGIKILQCETCRKDGREFYSSIGSHKSPFEKMFIFHNYVNRKLNKNIVSLDECLRVTSDIYKLNGALIDWTVLLDYYFNLLFLISKYVEGFQLNDFKKFSGLVYDQLKLPKKLRSNAIEVKNSKKNKIDREQIQLQTFDYYNKSVSSISSEVEMSFQSYKNAYGTEPRKPRTCNSCAKRHQLYMERHQLQADPKVETTVEVKTGNEISEVVKKPPSNFPKPSVAKPNVITQPNFNKVVTPTILNQNQVQKKQGHTPVVQNKPVPAAAVLDQKNKSNSVSINPPKTVELVNTLAKPTAKATANENVKTKAKTVIVPMRDIRKPSTERPMISFTRRADMAIVQRKSASQSKVVPKPTAVVQKNPTSVKHQSIKSPIKEPVKQFVKSKEPVKTLGKKPIVARFRHQLRNVRRKSKP